MRHHQHRERPSEYVLVGLCVNDDSGNFTGKVSKIDIEDGVDICVELEHADMLEEDGGDLCTVRHNFIVIADKRYSIEPGSACNHVGNMLWDAVRMEEQTARRMVRDLVTGDWSASVCAAEWRQEARF